MDLGVWTALFLTAPLSDEGGAQLWLDLHARRDAGRFTGIVRPALGWAFSPSVAVHAGYGWIPGFTPDDGLSSEHRVWQQVFWTPKAGPFTFGLRPRFEQRFAAGVDGVGLRTRLFGRAQYTFADTSVVAVAWDELFVAVNDSGFVPAGLDQNRLFLGPGWVVEGGRIEVGALVQNLMRDGDWSTVAVAATNVFVKF